MFILRKDVYLDNNATTKVSANSIKALVKVLKKNYGNPSSLYKVARSSAEILHNARKTIAESINAEEHEIFLTGCATESNNTILKALTEHFFPKKKRIISLPIEHASVMETLKFLENKGVEISYLSVNRYGHADPAELEKLLADDVFLVCIMYANNEIGSIQNISELSRITHEKGVLFMCDSVQALGKIPLDMKLLNIDYASFSAHKIHGPKGVGALYVKKGGVISPLLHGGHQEEGLRAGTESLHNIAGFSTAVRDTEHLLQNVEKIRELKKSLQEGMKEINSEMIVNSPSKYCLPNTLSVTFPGHDNAVLMGILDYYGISVSAGSACNTQENAPSHVLKAIGLTDEEARATLRFSFSHHSSQRDVKYVLKILRAYFSEDLMPVSMISPAQLTEEILLDEETLFLDVRFWTDRLVMKGLSNSWEIPFFSFKKYIKFIPKNRRIVVICQAGGNSPLVAYHLRQKGYDQVSFLMTGLVGWIGKYPGIYKKYCGNNIRKLGKE